MEIKISFKLFLVLILLILATTIASAEVLVMNLNSVEYSAGEAGKVFGYVLDNSYSAESGVNVSIYLGGSFESIETTDLNGYYEYYVTNLTQGTYNISTNTSLNEQILTFEVYPAKPKYQIIALSLVVPYINPVLDFTVNKYLGQTLTNNSYSYSIYYPNGTTYASSGVGVSGTEELNVSLPQEVGLYTIVVDEKKSFTVAVSKFTLKFKVTDSAGNQQDVFKPNGIAYFQVEGFSNGQKISNATVTAKTIDPTGGINTVTFIETNGIYKGNTNVTQSGTAIQLRGGDYEVEFTMKDSSNNEQKVKGYFKVLGLSVDVNLVDKKPYRSGEDAEFDVIVKNLADGTLVEHADIVYFFELEKDGQFYDISALNASEASDSTITSTIDLTIPVGMEDGGYFLNIRVESSSNTGSGNEYLEVSNTDLFLQLTDNFDDYREFFKPGERAKAKVQSNVDLVNMTLEVFTKQGHVPTLSSTEDLTGSAGSLTFTVPTETGQYRAKVTAYSDSGAQVVRQKWFSVQNYHSFLDVRNLDNNPQFILTSGESFFGVINVFDITTNSPADLSDFRIKFDKIVNEETGKEYKNMRTTKNVSLSSETTGQVAYKIVPPSLPNGFYKIQYTLVDDEGESFYGEGWFGISAFDVEIETYDSNGRQKKQFSSGESINITVSLSSGDNGTATLHREFYDEASFSIINGEGSVLLSSTSTDDALKIPSQAGFYPFGIEVENQDDETGLGDNFFEIRNLNFRSVSVRNNGKYATGADILADVVVEKQGDLVEDVNVSLTRVVRSNDWFDVSDQIIDTGAAMALSSVSVVTNSLLLKRKKL